VLLEVLSYLPP
jgi:hypothetical protein